MKTKYKGRQIFQPWRPKSGGPPTDDLDPELKRLRAILADHPGGLREYDILQILRGEQPLRGLDELGLFRIHFLLFHHLYRLRIALEARGLGSVEIHCLKTRLVPAPPSAPNDAHLPLAPDPLAEYYLDLGNLERTTREEVQDLMRWFWRAYRVHGRREEALSTLGLGVKATWLEIRRRYRELVRSHHPDRGGDPDPFLRVTEAMEILRALEP